MRGQGRRRISSVYHAIAYLYPGLHSDGYDEPGSGWPRVLKRFAAEAWRRAEAGELADSELYPGEAAWCSLYDTLARPPTAGETRRRVCSAALHGIPF